MQVILIATNYDSRLRPVTDTTPAALVPIVNRPVIALALEILARAGLKRIVVVLGRGGDQVVAYCQDGRRWGVQIEYVTIEDAGNASAALAAAAHMIQETTLLLSAEALLDLEIDEALTFHRAWHADATLILQHPGQRVDGWRPRLDAAGRVLGQLPNKAGSLVYTEACLLEPHMLQHLAAQDGVVAQSLPDALVGRAAVVYGYQMRGYWNPLDSFQAYQEAQRVYLYSAYESSSDDRHAQMELPRVRYAVIEGLQIAPGVWAGPHRMIARSAHFMPPVCIGENCRIGPGAEVGPEVVIGSNVIIDHEVTIRHSTVLGSTYVGRLINSNNLVISRTTIIDTLTSVSTQIVDTFLLAEVNPLRLGVRLAKLADRWAARLPRWLRGKHRPGGQPTDEHEYFEPVDHLRRA
jgi:NDP-sugar pyrophosphorylase family protein